MDGKTLARIGAVILVAVAITATAIELTRKNEGSAISVAEHAAIPSSDPLRDELIRCQRLGEAGPRDAACLRAWAESRKRFLSHEDRPVERLPQTKPEAR